MNVPALIPTVNDQWYSDARNAYFMKIACIETLFSFVTILIMLLFKYDPKIRNVNILIQAAILTYVFVFAYTCTAGDTGSYNPAFALAVITYFVGLADHNYQPKSNFTPPNSTVHGPGWYASSIWVYLFFPFLGAFLAMFVTKLVAATKEKLNNQWS